MPSKVCYIFLFGYAPIVSQALRLAPQPGDFPPLKGYVNTLRLSADAVAPTESTDCKFETLQPSNCELPAKDFLYNGRPWEEYGGRWAKIEKALTPFINERDSTLIDMGSNYGYFSLRAAMMSPKLNVFGIEGSIGAGNGHMGAEGAEHSPAVIHHLKWIGKLALPNCAIVNEVWNYDRVSDLLARGFKVDAMLILSVFHHIDNASLDQYKRDGMSHLEGTVHLMAKMLQLASMNFVELPTLGNAMRNGDTMRLKHVYEKYKNEKEFLNAAIQVSSIPKVLTKIYKGDVDWLDDQGHRSVFVIQNAPDQPQQALPSDTVQSYFIGSIHRLQA